MLYSGLLTDLYLKLEDVTHRFKKPCIMDVKIGQKSYDPYASAEKIKQQVSKYPLMEEIGFLVLGMRVRSSSSFNFWQVNVLDQKWTMKDLFRKNIFLLGLHIVEIFFASLILGTTMLTNRKDCTLLSSLKGRCMHI